MKLYTLTTTYTDGEVEVSGKRSYDVTVAGWKVMSAEPNVQSCVITEALPARTIDRVASAGWTNDRAEAEREAERLKTEYKERIATLQASIN